MAEAQAKGEVATQSRHPGSVGRDDTAPTTLPELGVSRDESSEWKKLASEWSDEALTAAAEEMSARGTTGDGGRAVLCPAMNAQLSDDEAAAIGEALYGFLDACRRLDGPGAHALMLPYCQAACTPANATGWAMKAMGWDVPVLDAVLERWMTDAWDTIIGRATASSDLDEPQELVWVRGPRREPKPFLVAYRSRRVGVAPEFDMPAEMVPGFLGNVAERPERH